MSRTVQEQRVTSKEAIVAYRRVLRLSDGYLAKPLPHCPTRHRNSAEICDRWIWCSKCGARRFIGKIGEVMWKRWQYPKRGK